MFKTYGYRSTVQANVERSASFDSAIDVKFFRAEFSRFGANVLAASDVCTCGLAVIANLGEKML